MHLNDYASVEHAQIRVFADGDLLCTQTSVIKKGAKAPPATRRCSLRAADRAPALFTQTGYRVAVRELKIKPDRSLDGCCSTRGRCPTSTTRSRACASS